MSGKHRKDQSDQGRTALIFCGGTISETLLPHLQELIRQEAPLLLAADRGLLFLLAHDLVPDLVVGDFDSLPQGRIEAFQEDHPEVEVRRYNPVKDYTDAEIAARAAVQMGCGRVILIGATGTRIDHMLGNLQVLAWLLSAGVQGIMIDPCNRITLHGGDRGGEVSIRKGDQWGDYISLFAYGGDVTGLTLRGFCYEVDQFLLRSVGSRAVSNEIREEEGRIAFASGRLLVIESKDT